MPVLSKCDGIIQQAFLARRNNALQPFSKPSSWEIVTPYILSLKARIGMQALELVNRVSKFLVHCFSLLEYISFLTSYLGVPVAKVLVEREIESVENMYNVECMSQQILLTRESFVYRSIDARTSTPIISLPPATNHDLNYSPYHCPRTNRPNAISHVFRLVGGHAQHSRISTGKTRQLLI